MRVRYTVPAQADLDDIFNYISDKNPYAAERVKRQIKTDAELLGELPYIAKESEIPGLRVRKVKQYPYLIYYSVRDNEVRIIRVRHGARRPLWDSSKNED